MVKLACLPLFVVIAALMTFIIACRHSTLPQQRWLNFLSEEPPHRRMLSENAGDISMSAIDAYADHGARPDDLYACTSLPNRNNPSCPWDAVSTHSGGTALTRIHARKLAGDSKCTSSAMPCLQRVLSSQVSGSKSKCQFAVHDTAPGFI